MLIAKGTVLVYVMLGKRAYTEILQEHTRFNTTFAEFTGVGGIIKMRVQALGDACEIYFDNNQRIHNHLISNNLTNSMQSLIKVE